MALNGTYKVVKDENTTEFFIAMGLSVEEAEKRTHPDVEMVISSLKEYYTVKFVEGKRTRETKFRLNYDYQEPYKDDEFIKCKTNLENEKLVTIGKTENRLTLKKTFEKVSDMFLLTMDFENIPIVSRRYMQRIQERG